MTKSMLVAASHLSSVSATFAWAQGAVQEPGAYGFYHPDGDVLHAGSGQYGSRAESHGAIGIHNAMAATTVGRHAGGHRQVGRNNRRQTNCRAPALVDSGGV